MNPLILYIITDLELGGVPLHLFRLAAAMKKRGFRITVASLAPPGPVGTMLGEHGIQVLSCGGCCGLDFRVIPRLGEIIEEIRPDLIHSLLFHANQSVRLAAILTGFPTDYILSEIQTVEVERRWHLWVDRWTHGFCHLTIGNSPSVIAHLQQAARIPLDRLHLIRGGIDVNRIAGAVATDRASLGLTQADPILMWVGRLDPVKGLDVLIQAMRSVVDQTGAHLFLIGDGPERGRLESLVGTLRLASHVHFLGPRTDVPSLLRIANVFVFPSRTEGLPNALLEAMAAGKPIVATDVPGCHDLIVHEKNGLLVPFGDTRMLNNAIGQLLSDRALATQLGEKASADAAMKWNIESTLSAYESLYRNCLKPSR